MPVNRPFLIALVFAWTFFAELDPLHGDEIFFRLDGQFNARILANDAGVVSGRGFGGDLNVKCLNPSATKDGILKSYNYVHYQLGPLAQDNAILLPLGRRVEIPLPGQPRLTSLAFLYTAFRYDDAGGGEGKVTVTYADGGTQEFPWKDFGKSGVRNPPPFDTCSVAVAGFYDQFIAKEGRNEINRRFHNRVLNGLDPSRAVAAFAIDTQGFVDPAQDAEWAVFAVTGNGKLGTPTPLASINSGQRPYELVWAGRTQDEHPPLVDFQDVSGWKASSAAAQVFFASTTEKPLFLPKSARLELRTQEPGTVALQPPAPVDLPSDFDAVSLWVHGDGLMLAMELSPENKLSLKALFQGESGRTLAVSFTNIRHGEWFLLHHQFTPEELRILGGHVRFTGFEVGHFGPKENRVLYLANFAVFKEAFAPLTFKPQPERGTELLPGADPGIHTGNGRLPFPTRPETILPLNFSASFKSSGWMEPQTKGHAVFSYEGDDCSIRYTYTPERGDLGDLKGRITYPDGTTLDFVPAVEGGPLFGDDGQPPTAVHFLDMELKEGVLTARWQMTLSGGRTAPVAYRFRLWQKSLVADVLCEGGQVSRVRFGRTTGLREPRLVATPYYTYNVYSRNRPAVVVSGDEKHPLFFAAHMDWYLSNGSEPYALNSRGPEGVTSNGGVHYRPKTDGRRQNCAERFFFTASPVYDEVLPTIANPPSPYRAVGYNAMWRSFASAQSRYHHGRSLYRFWRQGIKEQNVTDHETLFRDHEESFTFRTRTAPLKGGDEGARWISDYIRNTLGYRYGPYCPYTDIGTLNEHFRLDRIIRTPENQLQHGWFRMYAPKPAWAQEIAAKIAPELKQKFGYSNSYCDVHTAIAPWHLVDYDSRSPGAATFAQTFYSYGQLFLNEKKAWDGPAYSEGNYQAYYSGLTDGNYAQDKGYRLAFNPWLVNFDLRNMHNLDANFGMGDMYMFMWESGFDYKKDKAAGSFALDRMIAATLAYGHAAIMPASLGMNIAAPRTHFMAVPVTRLYGLSPVASIQYAGKDGAWHDASKALLDESYVNSQLLVRYQNGTTVVANGAPTNLALRTQVDGRALDLPQNGYAAWSGDGKTEVISTTGEFGSRFDYAVTPEHIYIDGRGRLVRQKLAAANGPAVLRITGPGEFEYIPFNAEFEADYLRRGEAVMAGFPIQIDSVTAHDFDLKPLSPKVEVRVSRGLSWVTPVRGAYSYVIKGKQTAPSSELTSESPAAFPGQSVAVNGKAGKSWTFTIPTEAETGRQMWKEFDGHWIDFALIEPFQFQMRIVDDKLAVEVKSLLPQEREVVVESIGMRQSLKIAPNATKSAAFDLPGQTGETTWTIRAESGDFKASTTCRIKTFVAPRLYTALTERGVNFGVSLRGGQRAAAKGFSAGGMIAEQNALTAKETVDVGGSGAAMSLLTANCGGVARRAIGLQVPYKGVTGYVYVSYDNLEVPSGGNPVLKTAFGKRDGSSPGDGMLYQVLLTDEKGKEIGLGQTWVKDHTWADFSKDLKPWAGQKVTLKFICDAGGNAEGDWGALACPEIIDANSTVQHALVEAP